ncbi:allantoate permease [Fusarium circinatum]|uniref:Allantoate permease n=1 Tax=Fusarium circinatum TaxID=48490 RepID=A0A8H5TH58_FUSCI|nr:allantoate permease [Fusarium circinatum]
MKVTSFLTALAGVHSVTAYEYVYLVNSVKGNEVSSGMAYYGDKNPPGNMTRPSDYTDVTHGTFTYWEGKAVKAVFPKLSFDYLVIVAPYSVSLIQQSYNDLVLLVIEQYVPTSDLALYFFWVSELQYLLFLRRYGGYTKIATQWMTVPIWITGTVCQLARSWKRSIAIAFVNPFGHLAIIYGIYLWPSTNNPQHLVDFATLTATCGLGCVLAIAAPGYLKLHPKSLSTRPSKSQKLSSSRTSNDRSHGDRNDDDMGENASI